MTKVDECNWAEIGTGASMASSNQGKKINCADFKNNAITKPKAITELIETLNTIFTEKKLIKKNNEYIQLILLFSKINQLKNKLKKKNISPICDIQKTFKAALIVDIRWVQYWTSKKDTILIYSQNDISKKISLELKNK